MAKKKKSKTVSVRPKTSPYTSLPITVYFGVDRQRYYIQDALLKKLENLPLRSPWTSEMAFEDVEADIGHILIHFLHTGTYQTLDKTGEENVEVDETDIVINEFQKAVRASEAASKYGAPGLQQLAQAEMERRGTDMNLRDAVRAISEDSIAKPLDENTWLQDFVSQKVQSAFMLNSEVFTERDFFERISSHTLTKILARNVVGLYSEKVLDLQKKNLADGTLSPFGYRGHTSYWNNWVNPYVPRTTSERPSPKTGTCPEPVEKLEVLDDSSTARDPHILKDGSKPSTPGADASSITAPPSKEREISKKAAMLPKIADHAEDATRVEAPEPTPAHTIPVSVQPEAINTVVVLSGAGAEKKQDDFGWSDWGSMSTSSKKKKKKKGVECVFDIPVPATDEAEPEPERATEPPLPESAPEAAPTVEPPSTEIEEEIWGEEWGGTKKKSKKGKGKATYETPSLEPEPAPDSDLIVPNAIGEDAGDARSTVQTTTIPGSDDCPRRLGHLFEGDGWRTCKLCQAYMRGMASKLHAAGLSDVNGFGPAV